jgi:preprotein translocase SecF subunit
MFTIFQNTNYRFIAVRWVFLTLSIVCILAGVISLIAHGGPELGIDFKGGYKFILSFEKPADLTLVRQTLDRLGYPDAQVTDFSEHREIRVILPVKYAEVGGATGDRSGMDLQARFATSMRAAFTDNPIKEISQEKVGPKIGAKLRTQGMWAILYSMLGILIYVTWRFEFRFAIAAIVATIHDILIILGLFSILGKEIDLTILGALLTIVGYSLNDTIVVFDRIRENLRQRRRGEIYADIINSSINQTLSRTVITGLGTLFTLIVLLVSGGPVIHDFALMLLVGIVVGTYSSIFIASPVLVEWQAAMLRHRERRLATAT